MAKKSLTKRIFDEMKLHPREHYSAILLDRILSGKKRKHTKDRKKPIQLIGIALNRMEKRGLIKRDMPGYYSIKITTKTKKIIEQPQTCLHNIKIIGTVRGIGNYQKGGVGTPQVIIKNIERFMDLNYFSEEVMKRRSLEKYWEGRLIHIAIHECGTIEITVNCSDKPLNGMEFKDMITFLKGFLSIANNLDTANLVQIHLNKDFIGMQLDGAQRVKLKYFENAYMQVYNKEELDVMRVEVCLEKTSVPVSQALQMIEYVSFPFSRFHKSQTKLDSFDSMFV
jgi:hypothetical protein